MTKHRVKAVVLGANYFIGLGVIRRLGSRGVPVVACDYNAEKAYGFRSKYLSEKLITPHYRNQPEKFIEFIIDYAKKQKSKPVLLPCADPYVEIVDANRDLLKEYFRLPSMPQGLQTSLLEKQPLAEHCIKQGVRIPETIPVDTPNLLEVVEQKIGYPCIIKPVNSYDFVAHFRHKMFKVHNPQELQAAIKKATDAKHEVFVQRIIKGFDDHMYTYDAHLNEQSKVTHWATCQKYRQYPINFGASVYTMQRYVPELHEIGAPFLEAVGYKGFAEIEFKKDAETGNFYLIEINARYTTLDVLFDKLGIAMPYVTYRELIGRPLPPKHLSMNSQRYFWYAYEDFLAVRHYIQAKQLTTGHVVKSYFNKKAYAIWDIKDPMPFFSFNKQLIKKIIKRRRNRKNK